MKFDMLAIDLGDCPGNEIFDANEAGNVDRVGEVIDGRWRTDLENAATANHGDTVSNAEGILKVVGDEDGSERQFALQRMQVASHLHAQFMFDVGEGIIKQQQARFAHQRTGQGDALLLSAGELQRMGVAGCRNAKHDQELVGTSVCNGAPTAVSGAKNDVLVNGHVRPEGEILENHAHGSFRRRDVVDQTAVDHDLAGRGVFQASQHA